jgi:lysozyme
MKTSFRGRKLIEEYESLRLEAYPDPGTGDEPWTIGVGHTSSAGFPKVTKGMKISKEYAYDILKRDLKKTEDIVSRYVTAPLSQNQFDALVSFTFNLGPQNLRVSTLLKKVNRKDFEGASREFQRWNKADGKILSGLTRRRKAEEDLFRKGE